MQLSDIIRKTTDFVKKHPLLRALYYAAVIAALLYIAISIESGDVAFVYNEF